MVAFGLSDGEATPVNHIFSPIGKDEKGILWFEQTTPVVRFPPRVSISLRKSDPTKPNVSLGTAKAVYATWLPTPETTAVASNGYAAPEKVSYTESARTEYSLPERGTSQGRKNLRVLHSGFLLNGTAAKVVDDLSPPF